MRTIEVIWKQSHTTILALNADGSLLFCNDTNSGPIISEIVDPDGPNGGPVEINQEKVRDFIADELT